ncbi:MarR family winged helix-turn-helix transcriptional regulator [bacterium]|nr:MarR family winged helix-turn-helix transcriptional regulator [bacterium]
MAESLTLDLFQACTVFQRRIGEALGRHLAEIGYEDITVHQLEFLSQLQCGVTVASELARMMGISRQAVHKQVRALVKSGYLEQGIDPGRGNQNMIGFTARGIQLIADCRAFLARLDDEILKSLSGVAPSSLPDRLSAVLSS